MRVLPTVLLLGCGDQETSGSLFDVELTGIENNCTTGGANASEQLTYRVTPDVPDATLAVGEDEWGFGTIDGCNLTYQSIVWDSLRDDEEGNSHVIEWQITGFASINLEGGDGCAEEGLDWLGEETFTVFTSGHPGVDPGCSYTLETRGVFTGFAGDPPEVGTIVEEFEAP